MTISFDLTFEPNYGKPVPVGDGVRRLTANNPSPFTFYGTNSYIIGTQTLAVVDPGPDDDNHLRALLAAVAGRPVSHIIITHSHSDHSSLALRLKRATGALIASMDDRLVAESSPLQKQDRTGAEDLLHLSPDIKLTDGACVNGDGWRFLAVHTPGHASDHVALALEGTGYLFSGDHVMGWSTTVVVPPDGSMSDYMTSLETLLSRDDSLYFPGHGDVIQRPRRLVAGLKAHRRAREAAIVERLKAGDHTIEDLVRALYRDKNPSLHVGAGFMIRAHLEDLVSRGLVRKDASITPSERFLIT